MAAIKHMTWREALHGDLGRMAIIIPALVIVLVAILATPLGSLLLSFATWVLSFTLGLVLVAFIAVVALALVLARSL